MSRTRALAIGSLVVLSFALPGAVGADSNGTWSALQGTAAPEPRREYAAVYDASNHQYVIFGGATWGAPNPSSLLSQAWALSLDGTPAWNLINAVGPGERHSPQWGYDPARKRLIVFGGYGHHYPGTEDAYLDDVWELSLDGTPTWTELLPTGPHPTGRLAGASIYDPLRQRFIVYGGTVGASMDTWQLDVSGDDAVWSILPTADTPPVAGYGMTSIYDAKRDRMLMFGGSTSDGYYGVTDQVWELTLSGVPNWSKVLGADSTSGDTTALTGPCARRTLASIYDPRRDRMVIFGGWDSQSNNLDSFLGDTWALSLDPPAWTQLDPAGSAPVGRDAMAAVYDSENDRMVVYGGWSGATFLDDTWFLNWNEAGALPVASASVSADPDAASVSWSVANGIGTRTGVFRRQAGTEWSYVATVDRNGAGGASYVDHDVTPGQSYSYLLVVPSQRGEQPAGQVSVTVPTGVTPVPAIALAVRPSANPVSGALGVSLALPNGDAARLALYDVSGRQVRTREVGSLGAGNHQVQLARKGELAPGLYFLQLTQSGRTVRTRVAIVG